MKEVPETANLPEERGSKVPRYVGPPYDQGIVMPGELIPVRPQDFSPAEIKAFVEAWKTRQPDVATWWK